MLNAALGFFQEAGAERALLALTHAVELSAPVVRDGRERTIPAAALVPGDLIVVREGDRVPADARVVAAERFAVDESALIVYLTPVQGAFGTVPLGARELGLVLGLAALPTILVELAKTLRRRRTR